MLSMDWLRRLVSTDQSDGNSDYEYFIDQSMSTGSAFSEEDVQILLFQSVGGGEKVLLYDSRVLHQENERNHDQLPNAKRNFLRGDVQMYGEIMFGTVPTAFSGQSTKVHLIQDRKTIFMTKLFQVSEHDYKSRIQKIMKEKQEKNGRPRPHSPLSPQQTSANNGKPLQKQPHTPESFCCGSGFEDDRVNIEEGRESFGDRFLLAQQRSSKHCATIPERHVVSTSTSQRRNTETEELQSLVRDDGGYMQKRKERSTNTSIEHGQFRITKSTSIEAGLGLINITDRGCLNRGHPNKAEKGLEHSQNINHGNECEQGGKRVSVNEYCKHCRHGSGQALNGIDSEDAARNMNKNASLNGHIGGDVGRLAMRSSATCSSGRLSRRDRPLTYGVGVLFTLSDMTDDAMQHSVFEDFFFTHFSFIEMRVQWLYAAILHACSVLAADVLLQAQAQGKEQAHALAQTHAQAQVQARAVVNSQHRHESHQTAVSLVQNRCSLYLSKGASLDNMYSRSMSTNSQAGRRQTAPLTYLRAMILGKLGLQRNIQTSTAIVQFRTQVSDLYLAPRLREPVWLTMATHPECRTHLGPAFLNQLCTLYGQHRRQSNTKNVFAATAITALLTHHLAWVPTLVPTDDSTHTNHLNKATLPTTHNGSISYNPFWAQLNDLYGGLSKPVVVARTVVVGSRELSCSMVFVMSHFLRCFEVFERIEVMEMESRKIVPGFEGIGQSISENRSLNGEGQGDPTESNDLLELPIPETRTVRVLPDASDCRSSCSNAKSHAMKDIHNHQTLTPAPKSAPIPTLTPTVASPRLQPQNNPPPHIQSNSYKQKNQSPMKQSCTVKGPTQLNIQDEHQPNQPQSNANMCVNPHSAHANTRPHTRLRAKRQPSTTRSDLLFNSKTQCTPHFIRSLGRSLIGGFFNSYQPDFALQAVPERNFIKELSRDLLLTVKDSVIEEPIGRAVGVIADANAHEVIIISTPWNWKQDSQFLSDEKIREHIESNIAKPASLITAMLQAVTEMWNLGLPSETCLWYLEDQLQNVYFKSKVLAEILADRRHHDHIINRDYLATAVGVDQSNIELLMAVIATYANHTAD
eukprot:CFRG2018T1